MSVRSARYNRLSLRSPKGTSALPRERDAWAFLDAAGITSSRQQEAVIQLVRDFKGYGLWSKMKAIYPFVGGTATTHKFNLKDPRDADAAFRLTFSGGWTHGSTGAKPNGTTGYADTFIVPNNNLSQNSTHYSVYHRENRGASDAYMVSFGAQSVTGLDRNWIIPREGGPPANTSNLTANSTYVNPPVDSVTFTDTNSQAYYLISRTSNALQTGYRNGISQSTNTRTNTSLVNSRLYLGAYNTYASSVNTANYFSNLQTAFATIGDGLTDTDATNLYNAVDRYQKFLGRAV